MFTSRAEYRLLLRQDNADRRLMHHGHRLGLLPEKTYAQLKLKEELIAAGRAALERLTVRPSEINPVLTESGSGEITQNERISQILRRSDVPHKKVFDAGGVAGPEGRGHTNGGTEADGGGLMARLRQDESLKRIFALRSERLRDQIFEAIDIEFKYEGYLRRQEDEVKLFEVSEGFNIPDGFDYHSIKALSTEGREKLSRVQPASVGQASRISGVTASDISVLMVHLRTR
jgi:tRNA uridine 5-carboxymethylaminomethyl modification enzyme